MVSFKDILMKSKFCAFFLTLRYFSSFYNAKLTSKNVKSALTENFNILLVIMNILFVIMNILFVIMNIFFAIMNILFVIMKPFIRNYEHLIRNYEHFIRYYEHFIRNYEQNIMDISMLNITNELLEFILKV